MTIAINSLTVDSHDPRAVASFWSAALDWPILFESDDEVLDIGQGELDWIVMADVDGNEFCVLKSLPKEESA